MFVNEILLALAASGSGILRLSEGQLIDLASGGGGYPQALNAFLSSNFDTTDVSRPHAYLVWMLYDNNMELLPQGSGAKRVTDPNSLRQLLEDDIPILENGYLHTYVRSEEHTSELQSRPHLVCRLLLEKKKNIKVYSKQIT